MSKRGLAKLSRSEIAYVKKEARRIALEVRSRREWLGFTQESLAEELDVSVETIKGIELGYNFPSVPTLIRLCRVLKIQIVLQSK